VSAFFYEYIIKNPIAMHHLKLFENFTDLETQIESLNDWIEANSDHIDANSFLEEVKTLLGLDDQLVVTEKVQKDASGDEYGEDWSKKQTTIAKNGRDLISIWISPDGRYDYGKNTIEFGDLPKNKIKEAPFGGGARFFIDRSLL